MLSNLIQSPVVTAMSAGRKSLKNIGGHVLQQPTPNPALRKKSKGLIGVMVLKLRSSMTSSIPLKNVKMKKEEWKNYFDRNKSKVKKLEEALDVKNWFPDYFTLKLFRGAMILMFILFFFTLYINDWKIGNTFAACPASADDVCRNPFFHVDVTWKTKNLCSQGFCEVEYLQPGQVIGNPPGFYVQHFKHFVLSVWALAFVFNHLIYMFKYKEFIYRRELHE